MNICFFTVKISVQNCIEKDSRQELWDKILYQI